MENPVLNVQQVQEQVARKNFENLQTYFREQNQLLDFKFLELVFTGAETDFKRAHGCKTAPLDVIVTHISGPGEVTFKYDKFDQANIVLDVTGACRIRFFVGTYAKLDSSVQTAPGESQKVKGT